MINLNVNFNGRSLHYKQSEIDAVLEVLKNAPGLTQGNEQDKFQNSFNEYQGAKHSFAFSNAASAIEIAAILSGVGPGDEVIIPAHTYCASAIPFGRTGAKIVWADIDRDTFVVTEETLRPLINPNTKAIVIVHLYGLCADMPKILNLIEGNDIFLLEDCAQALGSSCNGIKAGNFGDMSVFSFQSQKNISTMGEGGMLCVKSPKLAEKVYGLRHNGHKPFTEPRDHYWKPAMVNVQEDLIQHWPYNFCLSEVQCAIGRALLNRVDEINELRRQRSNLIRKELGMLGCFKFQNIPDNCTSAYHLLPSRFDLSSRGVSRDKFIEYMYDQKGVKLIIQYNPLYRYDLFKSKGFGDACCPETDNFYDNMISFPFDLWMPDETVEKLIQLTKEAVKELS